MKTSDFDYSLPPELIAQTPLEVRDRSRLMVLDRKTGNIEHRRFFELVDYLQSGDVLVFNDSRVIPARLLGRKAGTGGRVEILLLRRSDGGEWEVLIKPGRRLSNGATIELGSSGEEKGVFAVVIRTDEGGIRRLKFSDESQLFRLGNIPLPPYIHTPLADPERYQTVYARLEGSVAAPTAGLHFTPGLLHAIQDKGISCLFVTLHVGLDTFRPVTEENPAEHRIYSEFGVVTPEIAAGLSRARAEGRRIICVGTTTVRIVEQAARSSAEIQPFEGWVSLFILPGFRFRATDALITNFHLPRSTLLMLVSAFAGKDLIRQAYEVAISERYRFYSFGDAMLIF